MMVSVTIHADDPRLAIVKAELLHGIPELTGNQINKAASLALGAIKRWDETSTRKEHLITTTEPIDAARVYQKFMEEQPERWE